MPQDDDVFLLQDLKATEYDKYLQSGHWRELSSETKRLADYRCQICNSPYDLNVHHRTYQRRGHEFQSDLICLCHKCHELFHNREKIANILALDIGEDYFERLQQEIKRRTNAEISLLRIVDALQRFYGGAIPKELKNLLEDAYLYSEAMRKLQMFLEKK